MSDTNVEEFPNESYGPKQILYRLAKEDKFQSVIVIGLDHEGKVLWSRSSVHLGFLAVAALYIQTMAQNEAQAHVQLAPAPAGKPT